MPDEQDQQQAQTTTENASGSETTNSGQASEQEQPKFTQAQLDAILKDRLDQERRQREKAAERAKEEAEAKALADQQKWKELAEQQAGRITELEKATADVETLKTRAERAEKTLAEYVAGMLDSVPEPFRPLLDRLDPVERLEWMTKNRDSLTGNGRVPIPGTPKPNGRQPSLDQKAQQDYEALKQSGRYRL